MAASLFESIIPWFTVDYKHYLYFFIRYFSPSALKKNDLSVVFLVFGNTCGLEFFDLLYLFVFPCGFCVFQAL